MNNAGLAAHRFGIGLPYLLLPLAPVPGARFSRRGRRELSCLDNGSAFTARRFRQVLSGLGIRHRRGGYRDPESQAFIESWFAKLKSAASGATSSRPSTRQGR